MSRPRLSLPSAAATFGRAMSTAAAKRSSGTDARGSGLKEPEVSADRLRTWCVLVLAALTLTAWAFPAPVGMSAAAASGSASQTRGPIEPRRSASCEDVYFIGARGSGQQLSDNEGFGPQVAGVLQELRARLQGFPVPRTMTSDALDVTEYPARAVHSIGNPKIRIDGYLRGIKEGTAAAMRRIEAQTARCPDQRIVLAGFSQGAMVMHRVAVEIPRQFGPQVANRVDGVVLLADGYRLRNAKETILGSAPRLRSGIAGALPGGPGRISAPVVNNTWSVCVRNDLVCDFQAEKMLGVRNWRLLPAGIEGTKIHLAEHYKSGTLVDQAADNVAEQIREVAKARDAVLSSEVGETVTRQLVADTGPTFALTWRFAPGASVPAGLTMSNTGLVTATFPEPVAGAVRVQVRSFDGAVTKPWTSATLSYSTIANDALERLDPDRFGDLSGNGRFQFSQAQDRSGWEVQDLWMGQTFRLPPVSIDVDGDGAGDVAVNPSPAGRGPVANDGTVYWAAVGDFRYDGAAYLVRQPMGGAATVTKIPAPVDGSLADIEYVPSPGGERVYVSWTHTQQERLVGVIDGTQTQVQILSTASADSQYGPENPYQGPPLLFDIDGGSDDGTTLIGSACVPRSEAAQSLVDWCPYGTRTGQVLFDSATQTFLLQTEPRGDSVSVVGFSADMKQFAWAIRNVSTDGAPDEERIAASTPRGPQTITVSGRPCFWPVAGRDASHHGMMSPDGRYVFCNVANDNSTYDLWRVSLVSGEQVQLSTGGPFDDGSLPRPVNNAQGYQLRWVAQDGSSAIFDVLSNSVPFQRVALLRWREN